MHRLHNTMKLMGCGLALGLLWTMTAAAQEPTVYGTGVTETESVSVAKLLDGPDEYIGKMVRVEGEITDVCPKMGCWIDIAGQSSKRPIRFKVEDGVIEFPVETKGQQVVAQGVFTKVEMTEAQALRWAQHLADERGEEFDPDTTDAPTTIYRIEGTGATVR
jgi:hypothetical protein